MKDSRDVVKVYTAERHYDYEGFSIIGIFETRAEADAACKQDTFKDGTKRGDWHEVNEHTLGIPVGY